MNEFWGKILPGSVKTDHGKFNGADLLIIVLDLILLGYTCYRSFRFLLNTFAGHDATGEFTVAAIIALVGLDIAAVAWSLVWMFGSTTKWQDVISLLMFVVSIIGMVLTSMTDTLTGEGSVPETLKFAAYYGVPAIILLNVAAGITYHMISPQVMLQRKERRMKADSLETKRLGELVQQDTAMKLDIAEKQARQNDELIARQERLAQQKMQLDGIQLGINRAMNDHETVQQKGQSVFEQLRNAVRPAPAEPTPQPERVLNDNAPAVPNVPPTSQPEPLPTAFPPRLVTRKSKAEDWSQMTPPNDAHEAFDLLQRFPVERWGNIYAELMQKAVIDIGIPFAEAWAQVRRLCLDHLAGNGDPVENFNKSQIAIRCFVELDPKA